MKWHGYEQGGSTHRERPWWRKHWEQRGDNTLRFIAWRRTDGRMVSAIEVTEAIIDVFEVIDSDSPLLCPPPLPGQVWVGVGDAPAGKHLITDVVAISYRGDAQVGWSIRIGGQWVDVGDTLPMENPWPLPDHELASGEGAPWADTAPKEQT